MEKFKNFPLPPKDKNGFPWTKETSLSTYKKGVEYPKITIITPSYNQGDFLEETIRSVLLQNYPNLEYIIIDGGSTDNSVDIIKKYEKWIDYWVSEADQGQTHAINKGLKMATGEVINWLNSDDWYLPNVLETVGYHFNQNRTLKVLSGKSLMIKNGTIVRHFSTDIRKTKEETIAKLDISQPSTFFRKDVIKNNVTTTLNYMFDAALWASFLLGSKTEELKEIHVPIAYYRLHENSKTVANALNFQTDRFLLLKALQIYFKLNLSIPKKLEIDNSISLKIVDYWYLNKSSIFINKESLRNHIYNSYLEQSLGIEDYETARKIAIQVWTNYINQPRMFLKIVLLLFPDAINKVIRKIKRYAIS